MIRRNLASAAALPAPHLASVEQPVTSSRRLLAKVGANQASHGDYGKLLAYDSIISFWCGMRLCCCPLAAHGSPSSCSRVFFARCCRFGRSLEESQGIWHEHRPRRCQVCTQVCPLTTRSSSVGCFLLPLSSSYGGLDSCIWLSASIAHGKMCTALPPSGSRQAPG